MSRPGKGIEHVESLEGDATSKERLKVILETLCGASSVEAACERLHLSPSRFHALREEALQGALCSLAPTAPGRRRSLGPDPTTAALEQENAALRDELEVSRLRTEIALAFPHLVVPPRGGQKGGSVPKNAGSGST